MAALPPWFLKATRYKYGLIPYKPRPADIPKRIPKSQYPQVYHEWDQFDLWNAWRIGHKAGKRPKVWVSVPGWAWTIAGELDQRDRHTPPPSPPKPKPPPLPPPTWSLPGPFVMSGQPDDDGGAHGRKGVGTVGVIIDQIDACPLWECKPVSGSGRGLCGQIEGQGQVEQCKALISKHRQPGDHLAVVSTLNVPAKPMLDFGVNVCFAELNAQAGWEPFANTARLLAQAHTDGWTYVLPSYGCYWSTGLGDYEVYVPMVWDTATNGFVPGHVAQGLPGKNLAIFSAQGGTDAGRTWEVVARL